MIRTVADINNAYNAGRRKYSYFYKLCNLPAWPGVGMDLSSQSGIPAAQYFIGAQATSTVIARSTDNGLDHGENAPSGMKKYLHKVQVQSPVTTLVTIGQTVHPTPVDITLAIGDVKVYGWRDQYIKVQPIMVKVLPPELLAFSTDITTDMEVVEAMEIDMDSLDGTQQVKLLRKTDNVVYDYTQGTAVPENKIYTFNSALIRAISDRDNKTIRQIRQSMTAVQNDEFHTMDTIIELPLRDDVEIRPGDIVQADITGLSYTVVGIDTCTLKTRWRLGARRIV